MTKSDRQVLVATIREKLAAKGADPRDIAHVLRPTLVEAAVAARGTHGDFDVEYDPPEGEIGRGADVAELGGCPWAVDPEQPIYWEAAPRAHIVPPNRKSRVGNNKAAEQGDARNGASHRG